MKPVLLFVLVATLNGCASAPGQVAEPARVLEAPKLSYPVESKRNREEGKVVIEVEVLPDGRLGARRVKASSGYRRLDAAALEASEAFRIAPARTAAGHLVPSTLDVPIVFRLEPTETTKPYAARHGAGMSSYAAALSAAVKRNIVLTSSVAGNPVCVVEVSTAPSGKITDFRVIAPSNEPEWDAAVLDALRKTGWLPLDEDGRVPPKLEITFKPR